MKDTCNFKDCIIAKKLKLKSPEECFNFIESWWTPEGTKQPIVVKDCINKRLFLMVQELHNRLTGVEKSQEELRNETVWVQVVAEVLGKNSGIDLEKFVEKRQQLDNIKRLQLGKIEDLK